MAMPWCPARLLLLVTRKEHLTRRPFYRFQTTWRIEASASDAFRVLNDIERYPAWWPEIKEARLISEARADVRVRAALPYTLHIRLQKEIADEPAGILRTSLSGDLEGWSSWSISPVGGECWLRFHEEVVTTRRLMNALAPIARPLFRLNHSLMMRHGERGLRRHLG